MTASVKREANGLPGQQQHRAWPSQHHLTFCWQQLDPDLAQHSQAPRYVPQWMTAWCIQSFLVWYCSKGVWLKTVGCMLLGKCSVTTTTKKEFTNFYYYNYLTASRNYLTASRNSENNNNNNNILFIIEVPMINALHYYWNWNFSVKWNI